MENNNFNSQFTPNAQPMEQYAQKTAVSSSITEKKTFFQKIKEAWADGIGKAYVVALVLQVLFIIWQFVPIMKVALNLMDALSGDLEAFSLISFMANGSETIMITLALLALFCLSTIPTINYFRKQGIARYGRFGLSIFSLILMLLWFALCIFAASGETYQTSELFEFLFTGHLYWIIGVVTLISLFNVSAKASGKRRELKEAQQAQYQQYTQYPQQVQYPQTNFSAYGQTGYYQQPTQPMPSQGIEQPQTTQIQTPERGKGNERKN